jgi:death-on-curing protein
METFLMMNGFELTASIDDAERTILTLAAGNLERKELLDWVVAHMERVST